MQDLVLEVDHRGEKKMVGKIIDGVFIHEERTPSQHHVMADSPGGIDYVVAHWLKSHDIPLVVHQSAEGAYMTTPDTLIEKGERRQEDGRDRLFLAYDQWDACEPIDASRWVRAARTIDWRDVPVEESAAALMTPPPARAEAAPPVSKPDVKHSCPCCGEQAFGPNGEWGWCKCVFIKGGRRCVEHGRGVPA